MKPQDCGQLTLSPVASHDHANLSVWLESKKGKTTTVIYGRKCSGLSENLRRVGLSVRMFLESCALPGTQYVRTWSVKATMSAYLIMKLRLSERRTGGSGYSLWATPNTMDYLPQRSPESLRRQAETTRKGRLRPANLREQVDENVIRMWPTPTVPNGGRSVASVTDWRSQRTAYKNGRKVQVDLNAAVRMWPTPKASDYKGSGPPGSKSQIHDLKKGNLKGAVMYATPQARDYRTGQQSRWDDPERSQNLNDQIGGQLNPTWVEWLQGFPLGWTDLNA